MSKRIINIDSVYDGNGLPLPVITEEQYAQLLVDFPDYAGVPVQDTNIGKGTSTIVAAEDGAGSLVVADGVHTFTLTAPDTDIQAYDKVYLVADTLGETGYFYIRSQAAGQTLVLQQISGDTFTTDTAVAIITRSNNKLDSLIATLQAKIFTAGDISVDTTDVEALLTTLNGLVTDILADTANMDTNIGTIGTDIGNIDDNITDILADTANMDSNITDILADTANMDSNITDILADTANMDSNITDILADTANIDDNVGTLVTDIGNIDDNITNIYSDTGDIKTNTAYLTYIEADYKTPGAPEILDGTLATDRTASAIAGTGQVKVRLATADDLVYFAVGNSSVEASALSNPLPANSVEYIYVTGGSDYIAAYNGVLAVSTLS